MYLEEERKTLAFHELNPSVYSRYTGYIVAAVYLQVARILQLCISKCPCCHVNQNVFLLETIITNKRKIKLKSCDNNVC